MIVHLRTGDEVLLSILWGFSHLSVGGEVAFTVGDERLQLFSTDGSRIAREVS